MTPGEGFASWALYESKTAEASARWRSHNCPGCGQEGLDEGEWPVGGQEIKAYQCTNTRCRVVKYLGPRAEE